MPLEFLNHQQHDVDNVFFSNGLLQLQNQSKISHGSNSLKLYIFFVFFKDSNFGFIGVLLHPLTFFLAHLFPFVWKETSNSWWDLRALEIWFSQNWPEFSFLRIVLFPKKTADKTRNFPTICFPPCEQNLIGFLRGGGVLIPLIFPKVSNFIKGIFRVPQLPPSSWTPLKNPTKIAWPMGAFFCFLPRHGRSLR